jgi:predicted CXXCH cytochrome family protein
MLKNPNTLFLRLTMAFLAIGFLASSMQKFETLTLVAPVGDHSKSYDPSVIFVVSAAKGAAKSVTVSTQWNLTASLPIATDGERNGFAKAFVRLFPQSATLESIVYSCKRYGGVTRPDTILFSYADTMSLRSFWQHPRFNQIMQIVKGAEASQIVLSIRGWKDTVITSEYEDPASGAILYKSHATLISGTNRVYFAADGAKRSALEYKTTLAVEASAIAGREARFHGAAAEEACVACHDGLPSKAKSLNGDNCVVCHKAIVSAAPVHAPVEAKDCAGCHEWSTEKKAVVVKGGTPDVCYGCHAEKKSEVENSTAQHPVAGDCLSCHSAHTSARGQMLKADAYELCTSCHDKHNENHPVVRHPVRFTKIKSKENKEITCASCHNPHGSETKSLLRSKGGKYELCASCHSK